MRLIDADALESIKYHPLPYTHIVPEDVDAEAYERGWNDAVDAIVEDAPTIEPEPKWIPCGERLPEEHIGFYLVTVQKRRITALNVVGYDNTVHDIDIARWDYDRRAPQRGYHWCKADRVIAWMPLPAPFDGGKR